MSDVAHWAVGIALVVVAVSILIPTLAHGFLRRGDTPDDVRRRFRNVRLFTGAAQMLAAIGLRAAITPSPADALDLSALDLPAIALFVVGAAWVASGLLLSRRP